MRVGNVTLAIVGLFVFQSTSIAQLRLEECYEKARQNYPLIKQKELLARSTEFSVANIKSGLLPQVSLNGQASYQSAVTKLPGPGGVVEPLSKDQYKLYAEVNQSIYDGGMTKRNSSIQETALQVEDQKLEVELYKIKERIHQLFFGTLLISEQLVQIDLVKKDLENNLKKTESAIRNGVAFKTSEDILTAELLKTKQREVEQRYARSSYLSMLSMFINQPLNESTLLVRPESIVMLDEPIISRPEISLFNYQQQMYSAQHQLTKTRLNPRVNLFLQGGYGRPGLNMLLNEFDPYYMGGLRFNWNLGGLYNSNRDDQLVELNIQSVAYQKQTFEFNTKLALHQQSQEITKLNELITMDEELIMLRNRIKKTANSQFENGVITTNDYLRELNAEDQARQNLSIHKIQLLMTQYNYLITSGN